LAKLGMQLHGYTAYSFLTLAYGMPALIIINIYFLKITPNIVKKCVIFFGEYSLELYLVHEFIFWSLLINFVNVSPWQLLLTGILLSCVAAYLCKLAINKCLS
jgi:peptidoglycan/LPS O-acetylase OafA/YrhL